MKSTVYYAVADNDFLFKKIITENISRSPFYRLSYSVNNGHELINALRKSKPDIVLIDLYMPVLSGMETIKFIRIIDRNLPLICYANTYQSDVAEQLARLNSVVYCKKANSVILTMLEAFAKGDAINRNAYEKEWQIETEERIVSLRTAEVPDLTVTELRLVKLTYEGFTNKEIALEMHLSNRTVDTYLTRLTEKLGLRSKLDLIRYAVEHSLYNTPL